MFEKIYKILFSLFIFIFILSCGYQPLLTEKNKKFSIDSFEISGDRKLGQMLANNFIKLEDSENNLMCKIEISKERLQSNKDRSGKILEYTLNVYLD